MEDDLGYLMVVACWEGQRREDEIVVADLVDVAGTLEVDLDEACWVDLD